MSGVHHPKYYEYYDLFRRVEGKRNYMNHLKQNFKFSRNPHDEGLYLLAKIDYEKLDSEMKKLYQEIYLTISTYE